MAWSKDSRQARGYGAKWDRLRLLVLKRDGHLCHCPDCQGGKRRYREATEVDHIKPKAWFKTGRATGDPDSPDNLRAVHTECHKKLTAIQKGHKPAIRIGLDGFPIDD